jgi:hypothetical protein
LAALRFVPFLEEGIPELFPKKIEYGKDDISLLPIIVYK